MKDIRDFIGQAEDEGMLHRIKAEVDWDLELSHIAKINEEKSGPALLFENVKGYDSPVSRASISRPPKPACARRASARARHLRQRITYHSV